MCPFGHLLIITLHCNVMMQNGANSTVHAPHVLQGHHIQNPRLCLAIAFSNQHLQICPSLTFP